MRTSRLCRRRCTCIVDVKIAEQSVINATMVISIDTPPFLLFTLNMGPFLSVRSKTGRGEIFSNPTLL